MIYSKKKFFLLLKKGLGTPYQRVPSQKCPDYYYYYHYNHYYYYYNCCYYFHHKIILLLLLVVTVIVIANLYSVTQRGASHLLLRHSAIKSDDRTLLGQ